MFFPKPRPKSGRIVVAIPKGSTGEIHGIFPSYTHDCGWCRHRVEFERHQDASGDCGAKSPKKYLPSFCQIQDSQKSQKSLFQKELFPALRRETASHTVAREHNDPWVDRSVPPLSSPSWLQRDAAPLHLPMGHCKLPGGRLDQTEVQSSYFFYQRKHRHRRLTFFFGGVLAVFLVKSGKMGVFLNPIFKRDTKSAPFIDLRTFTISSVS